ncbi:hypothetical protein [Quadrisphaera sp. DSM 44207]|uniref:hypothetical protein n=1 Tax=Quadrisphaera sp. DSM 44207 TaxID=1881057 RepID=UPI0015A184C4|nr:hypothetical protein [Quadrisphaera sp. DSM 44207]
MGDVSVIMAEVQVRRSGTCTSAMITPEGAGAGGTALGGGRTTSAGRTTSTSTRGR